VPARLATSMKYRNIHRLNAPASSMRIITVVRMFSKMRGGAKKKVGPISRRSLSTVALLSGHDTQKPAT
jgi:hypothetical protein